MSEREPDKHLAAVCGLFCPSCTVYIGSTEDSARLQGLAARSGRAAEQWECHGCRAEQRSAYCQTCKMSRCATEKGIDFCVECSEYPCEDLKTFQAAMPHRIELWQAQARIAEVGWAQWYQEMLAHYACPQCGTLNSAYDLACRSCGAEPGSAYVNQHRAKIEGFLDRS